MKRKEKKRTRKHGAFILPFKVTGRCSSVPNAVKKKKDDATPPLMKPHGAETARKSRKMTSAYVIPGQSSVPKMHSPLIRRTPPRARAARHGTGEIICFLFSYNFPINVGSRPCAVSRGRAFTIANSSLADDRSRSSRLFINPSTNLRQSQTEISYQFGVSQYRLIRSFKSSVKFTLVEDKIAMDISNIRKYSCTTPLSMYCEKNPYASRTSFRI
jgi:hypothetical protein